jgi:hypothetical protein
MKNELTHLTIEEITQIAARKLEQAAALAPSRVGPSQQMQPGRRNIAAVFRSFC